MSTPGNLSKLATTVQSCVSQIEEYMQENAIAQASFDIDSPLEVRLSPQLSGVREEALEALDSLHALLLGPLPYFMRLLSPAVNIFNSLQFVYRFRVAQHLGLDEKVSYGELASRCKVDPTDLRRFLRLAIANHVFQEPHRDIVAHSAMSRCLVDKPAFDDWVGLVCEDMLPASIGCLDAMRKWPGSSDSAHTGFAISNGKSRGFFDEMRENPLRASRFANGMSMNNESPALDPSFLVDYVPWADDNVPKSVIDVGGSHGAVGTAFLTRFPQIEKFVVQDLPNVTNGAHVPDGSVGRLVFEDYDFFTEQIHTSADVYLLRLVLHNWPDDKAIAILKNQVPAMRPQSRIILNEICLPDPGALTCYQEKFLRGFDLSMKHVYNGKERDAGDWAALIAKVDSRLQIQDIISPRGSLLSIIEVVMT